jgi:hypothetical protein
MMGVYDYVSWPDGPNGKDASYQTKDTPAQYLERHTIKNGRLIHHTCDYEECPKEERPYPNADDYRAVIGCIRRVPTGDKDLNWHGYIRLTLVAEGYQSYLLKFTDGNLVDWAEIEERG